MPKKEKNTAEIKISGLQLMLVLAVVIGSIFVPVLGVIGLILLVTLLVGYTKKFTLIESVGLATMLFFASTIVFYSLVTLLHAHFSLEYAPSVFLTLSILGLRFKYKDALPMPTWTVRKKSDFIALAVTTATFVLLLVPIFGQKPSYIAQFLSYGEDNASHYALSRYISHNGSFTYNQTAEEAGVVYSLEIYPQGFHVNASLFASLIKPFHLSEGNFIRFYTVFISLLYALFVFWLIKLCTYAIEKISWIIAISALPALALLGGLSFFLLMLDRGFQPQVFAFAFLLAITFTFMVFHQDKQRVKQMIFIILLLSVGISASWWFLLFIVFLLGLFYLLRNRVFYALLKNGKFLISLLLPLIGVVYPILVNIILSKKHDPLSEAGGVDPLPVDFLIWVAAASLVLPLIIRLKDKALAYLYIALGGSVALAAIIGTYHLARVGHLEYYFYKVIYAILAFLIIIASIGVLLLADKLFRALPKYIRLIIPTVFIGGVVVIALVSNLVFLKVYINNWFPNAVEVADTPILFTDKTDSYKDIMFVGDCTPASDYLSNRWSGARLLSESADRSKVNTAIFKGDWEKINTYLGNYVMHHSDILISIDRRCENKLPVLNDLKNRPGITLVYTH
ncbi:MAG TPA: hypothetical protein VFH06_01335 [Candidatus Saccharimonadales bacterium]|nr:hypothetical protein [Candidatus Saccharimonadales bacterium]